MIELIGKYNKDCKIFIDEIEKSALALIQNILDNKVSNNVPVRIMPDTHAGVGIVIGFTMPITNTINPEYIGVDIGCGVLCAKVDNLKYSLSHIDKVIRDVIPCGENIHDKNVPYYIKKSLIDSINRNIDLFIKKYNNRYNCNYKIKEINEEYIESLCNKIGIKIDVFWNSLGSLGGGNHFIEIDESKDGHYIMIHTGSRNFGFKICKYHTNIAKKQNPLDNDSYVQELDYIRNNTADKTLIPLKIKELKEKFSQNIDKCFLSGDNLFNYLIDMVIAQTYAYWNRQYILSIISNSLNFKIINQIESIHNYIDFNDWIVRKGAISAQKDKMCIIPLNMRDGVILCKGKGNPDWNYSAPHGAGRLMSRSEAKKKLSVDEFTESMNGIYSTSICYDTIDESPMAYKDASTILNLIQPTVEIIDILKPILNIKSLT